jgi:subtilisin family serine protease
MAAFSGSAAATEPFQDHLDTRAIGAAAFRTAHPTWDGRGTVIAILDTGVDPGAPGLERTSAGEVKVIETRDFSGESILELDAPSRETGEDGRPVWRARGSWVRGVDVVPGLPAGCALTLGFLDESRFKNSPVADLTGNGRTDDRIAVLVFQGADGEWRAVIDRDGDHDLAGEPVLRSYEKGFQHVRLGGGGDPSRESAKVPVSVRLGEDAPRRIELHIVAGSHGTHVAGIAAGFGLNGKAGFDGIAPGAKVLSLKIGDSALAGGATVTESMKKALEFAGKWAREKGVPVVANVSYGVGSALEGDSDIDRFLERFQEENPTVLVVTSAGNQGPGLSTVGTPGASRGVLSVAAVLTPGLSQGLVGAPGVLQVFTFSSRGGEAPKPDVAAPGIAASSVPPWERRDVMRGTSMAAPQVSGAAALVLSAFTSGDAGRPWHAGMVRQALRDGARPIPGFGPLDQGAGLVDVGRAFDALAARSKDADARWVVAVDALTDVPTLGGRKAGGAFWRAGGWAPGAADPVDVSIRARYLASAPGQVRTQSWIRFGLSTDAGWIRLSSSAVALRGSEASTVRVWVDRAAVSAPGLHVGTVTGRAPGGLAFQFPVAVVVPERVAAGAEGPPSVVRRGVAVAPGGVVRLFLAAPAGTTTWSARVRPSEGKAASVLAALYDGVGHRLPIDGAVSSTEGREARWALSDADLAEGGTMELDLVGALAPALPSTVDVEIRFGGLVAPALTVLRGEPGKTPATDVLVENRLAVPFDGEVRGEIRGYERSFTRSLEGDSARHGFTTSPEIESVDFDLELSPEDWNRFTDVAVNVVDRDGKAAVQTGFSNRKAKVAFKVPAGSNGTDWTLEIRAGRAVRGGPAGEVRITERYLTREKIPLVGTVDGNQRVRLWPTVRTKVRVVAAATPKAPPAGTTWTGSLDFTDRRDGAPWLRVPVRAAP